MNSKVEIIGILALVICVYLYLKEQQNGLLAQEQITQLNDITQQNLQAGQNSYNSSWQGLVNNLGKDASNLFKVNI